MAALPLVALAGPTGAVCGLGACHAFAGMRGSELLDSVLGWRQTVSALHQRSHVLAPLHAHLLGA